MPFTCHRIVISVAPPTAATICKVVTMLMEVVAGEIVTPIPVALSMQVFEDADCEVVCVVVDVVIEQETPVVVAGAAPHEDRPIRANSNARLRSSPAAYRSESPGFNLDDAVIA